MSDVAGNILPATWLSLELGKVVAYGSTEKVEPEAISPDTWVLELEDIEKDTSRIIQKLSFTERHSKSTKNCFECGDVLYGKLRPYLNKVVHADHAGVCTTEIVPIKPNLAVNGRFLYHWLRHPEFLTYVTEVSHGVNMPRLGTEAGRAAPFVLAPLPEQKRIADKLDSVLARVDACRDRLDRLPALLKRFRLSILAAATSGQLSLRKSTTGNFPRRPLTDLLSKTRAGLKTGPFGSLLSKAEHRATGIDVIGIENINDGKFVANSKIKIDPQKAIELSSYDLVFGDVVISRSGTVGEICAIPQTPEELRFSTNIIRVSLNSEEILPEYFVILFRGNGDVLSQVKNLCKGSTRMFLNQTILKEILYPVPSIPEQRAIVRRVEILFAFADRLEARMATARRQVGQLTPALLAKAFRGELVAQDPADEPAAELLKRLAAQRETAPKAKRGRASKA